MIREGLEEQGMECIRAIRERYDGRKRNPWNEYECGSNYARSMASYALLLIYSGFRYDCGRGMMGFAPIHEEGFTSFWSLDSGWGSVSYGQDEVRIRVLYGDVALSRLWVSCGGKQPGGLWIDGKKTAFDTDGEEMEFAACTARDEIRIEYVEAEKG